MIRPRSVAPRGSAQGYGLAGAFALALLAATQSVNAANTTRQNARLLIADGTSVSQAIGPGETRWFAFQVESGRAYILEVVDTNDDLASSGVGTIDIQDSTGASPPPDTQVDCSPALKDQPPALRTGKRCLVYVNAPDDATTNRRGMYVAVGQGAGSGVNIRVRDATMFGRWTTNGYDFHIEFDNTTSDQVCAQALLYRESGYAYSAGTWGDAAFNLNKYNLIIPPNGSKKIVVPDGSPVGGTTRGTLRILACPGSGWQYVPGSVHVSTYAFNPVTHVYLFFYDWPSFDGTQANSW